VVLLVEVIVVKVGEVVSLVMEEGGEGEKRWGGKLQKKKRGKTQKKRGRLLQKKRGSDGRRLPWKKKGRWLQLRKEPLLTKGKGNSERFLAKVKLPKN